MLAGLVPSVGHEGKIRSRPSSWLGDDCLPPWALPLYMSVAKFPNFIIIK